MRKEVSKVVVMGGIGAGKTQIINRMLDKPFEPACRLDDFYSIRSKLVDTSIGEQEIQFWDISGSQTFGAENKINRGMYHHWLSDTKALIIVLDGSRPGTITEESIGKYVEFAKKYSGEELFGSVPIYLVVNKVDRAAGSHEKWCSKLNAVSQSTSEIYSIKCNYLVVSAKDNAEIKCLFNNIMLDLHVGAINKKASGSHAPKTDLFRKRRKSLIFFRSSSAGDHRFSQLERK